MCDPIGFLTPPLHPIKLEILIPQESPYFSHNSCEILRLNYVSFRWYGRNSPKLLEKVVNHHKYHVVFYGPFSETILLVTSTWLKQCIPNFGILLFRWWSFIQIRKNYMLKFWPIGSHTFKGRWSDFFKWIFIPYMEVYH